MKLQNQGLTLLAVVVAFIAFNSCGNGGWLRTESGLLYKVYPSKATDSVARAGRTIKVNYIQKAGDSTIESTYEAMPYYEQVTSPDAHAYSPSAVFAGLKKGDSLIVKQRADSMLSRQQILALPSSIKKVDEWITTIKVLDVFASDSLLQADKLHEIDRVKQLQLSLGKERIKRFFLLDGISAAELEEGVFISPVDIGDGKKPVSGSKLKISYQARTLKGRVIDSQSARSKEISIGKGNLPEVLERALLYFREGDSVKIYAPAVLMFGVEPGIKGIAASDDLEYRVRVENVY